MATALVCPGSIGGLTRLLPLAQTTPREAPLVIEMPATVGSRPKAYFNQFGTPSPAGSALGSALGLVSDPKYCITHQSGKPPAAETPVRSAIEALSKPVAKGEIGRASCRERV